MRLCTILHNNKQHIAAVHRGALASLTVLLPEAPNDMTEFLAAPYWAERAAGALARVDPASLAAVRLAAEAVTYLPAVPRPGKIVCLGLNYRDHALETGQSIPDFPILFLRTATSLTGHLQPLIVPLLSEQLDYEAELAVVIGRRARHVAAGDADARIAGLACFNDGSIRDLQFRTSQFTAGKNFDRSGALGPEIVTLDELPRDPDALAITCRLNGRTVQRSTTAQHIVGVRAAIAIISSIMTLDPGDVIALGTPAGVGFARRPPLWLKPGDICDVEIEGVGVLRNPIAAEV